MRTRYLLGILLLSVIVTILTCLFFISNGDGVGLTDLIIENMSKDFLSCKIDNSTVGLWNNQTFYMYNYKLNYSDFDNIKKEILEGGVSEEYFNKHLKIIYVNDNYVSLGTQIFIYYKTDTWLDDYSSNGPRFLEEEKCPNKDCDICKRFVTEIRVVINPYGKRVEENNKVSYEKMYIVPKIKIIKNNQLLTLEQLREKTKECFKGKIDSEDIFLDDTGEPMYYGYQSDNNPFTNLVDTLATINILDGTIECIKQSRGFMPA